MISAFLVRPEDVVRASRLTVESLTTQDPNCKPHVVRPDWFLLPFKPGCVIILDTETYRLNHSPIDPLGLAAYCDQFCPVFLFTDNAAFDFLDERITRFRDIRPPVPWFFFLRQQLEYSERMNRQLFQVLQENRHLSNDAHDSLREAMTRQVLRMVECRNPRRLRIYRLLRMMARTGNRISSTVDFFRELSTLVDDELLLGIVGRFLRRCVAAQCGNRTYLKSLLAKNVRAMNRRHSASTLLGVLDFMRRSPYPADATFAVAMHILAPNGIARSIMLD